MEEKSGRLVAITVQAECVSLVEVLGDVAKSDMLNFKALEGEMADSFMVDKDGYEAPMNDKDMVVSGFKNKLIVPMGDAIP